MSTMCFKTEHLKRKLNCFFPQCNTSFNTKINLRKDLKTHNVAVSEQARIVSCYFENDEEKNTPRNKVNYLYKYFFQFLVTAS